MRNRSLGGLVRRLGGRMAPAVALLVAALTAASVRADDFADGVDAYVKGDYESAYRVWKPLADAEDPIAMFNIGVLHAQGLGIPQDPQIAAKWYERAAQGGYAPAQFNLGVAYLQGLGLQQDQVKAREWFLKAAEQNHRQAQYNLGSLYWHGLGVAADVDTAKRWFQKAADAGDEHAIRALALVESESPTPQAESIAERPLDVPRETVSDDKQSAAENDTEISGAEEPVAPEAGGRTGWIARQAPENYTVQLFADRSVDGAVRFMQKYDIPGMARFASHTGWHKVIAGSFLSRDEALRAITEYPDEIGKFKPWVRRMTEVQSEMSVEPAVSLPEPPPAVMDEVSPPESKQSAATAGGEPQTEVPQTAANTTVEHTSGAREDSLSAEERLAAAQQALGDQDFETARRYWEPLAKSGHPEAEYGLGFLYESGLGLARSDKSAFDWYRRAAGQGHSRAQFNLGILYMEGRGVVPNEGLGLYWIQSAADNNDLRAKGYLEEFRARLSATHYE